MDFSWYACEIFCVRSWDLISNLSSFGLSCRVGVNCVPHAVSTPTSVEWQECCADAFAHWIHSHFDSLTIHPSYLCWSIWVLQMPVDRYLPRSNGYWFFRDSSTDLQEAFVAFCLERVVLKGSIWVVNQEFALCQDNILLLTFI